MQVYCDMETDGGGWTVFQRRQDGSEDFYRGWDDYVVGFGDLSGESWLGSDKIHRLTNGVMTTLRIDIGDFEGRTAFAQYATFRVLNSSTNYTLNVAGYSGNAGDSLAYHNGQPFSTKDRDSDSNGHDNCAIAYSGAWWYKICHESNLNGLYHSGSHASYADGVNWLTWKGHYYSLRFSEMKLRLA